MKTYTFSRALHLMRYSGATMKSLVNDCVYRVINNELVIPSVPNTEVTLSAEVIMGSFVEIK